MIRTINKYTYINLDIFLHKKTSRDSCYTCDTWLWRFTVPVFRATDLVFFFYNPWVESRRLLSDPNWKFPREKNKPAQNHPKPPCQWDFDIDLPLFLFWPNFYGFFPGLERNATVFLFVTLFSARSPEPSDSLEVEAGSSRREILFRGGWWVFDTEAFCLNTSSGLLGGKVMVVFGWPTRSGNITRLELSLHCRYPVRRRARLVRQRSMHCCFRSVQYFGLFVVVAEHSLTFCRGFPCISCFHMFTALAFVSKFLVEIVVSTWLKGWKKYLWD